MTNIVETTLTGAPDRVKERDFASVLLWVITALSLAMLVWAALARVDEVVHAQGKVMPSSRLQVVSNLEGGVVAEILVHSGDKVAQGQPLLRLDATAVTADFNRSDTTQDALLARAESTLDPVQRTAALREFQTELMTDLPSIPVTSNPSMIAVTEKLGGFVPNPTNMTNFVNTSGWYLNK